MPLDPIKMQEILNSAENDATVRRRLRSYEALAYVYLPRPALQEIEPRARERLYDIALENIGDVPMLYLEFGVAGGKSMRSMAGRFKHVESEFLGFDTFEGLPEQWQDKAPGTFSMQGKLPVINDKRVRLVKGFFQDTLPTVLEELEMPVRRPILVHYDADLYSSTLFILSTLWHFIPEYFFIFDEFTSDEVVAMRDFMAAYPVDVEFICQTNAGGMPNQVLGRLKRCDAAKRYGS